MNKKQLWDLISKSRLSTASENLVKEILANFGDTDTVDKDKLESISKILDAEEKANEALAKSCEESIEELKKLN